MHDAYLRKERMDTQTHFSAWNVCVVCASTSETLRCNNLSSNIQANVYLPFIFYGYVFNFRFNHFGETTLFDFGITPIGYLFR